MLHLVSAAVLALDLVQHPAGLAVAEAVDRVLQLTPDDVRRLAVAGGPAAARRPDRDAVLACAAGLPRLDLLVRGVGAALAAAAPSAREADTMVDALGAVLVHRLDDVLDGLAHEGPLAGPGLPADGVQAALDGVAAAWLPAGTAPDALAAAARLASPWRRCTPHLPAPLPHAAYGGTGPAVVALLEDVARLDRAGWARVAAARATERGSLRWSTALHRACHAAVGAGRVLPVARAQLAAARALRNAGVSATADARAAAMAVTAAVQATCVGDVLDAPTTAVLLRPWAAAAAP